MQNLYMYILMLHDAKISWNWETNYPEGSKMLFYSTSCVRSCSISWKINDLRFKLSIYRHFLQQNSFISYFSLEFISPSLLSPSLSLPRTKTLEFDLTVSKVNNNAHTDITSLLVLWFEEINWDATFQPYTFPANFALHDLIFVSARI